MVLGTFLFGNRAFSQSYQPMLDERAEWHLTWCDQSCKTEVYYTDGDTIDNGQLYKVLNGFHYISRAFWLREDIASQRVWLSLIIDTKRQEFLLYDFSLQVGDSIAMYNPISPFPRNGGTYVVDSIIPRLLLDGNYHRFYYFSATLSVQNPQQPIWVEGLGSLSIINAPGGTPTWLNHGRISCYYKEAGQVYEDLDTINACNVRYLSSYDDTAPSPEPSIQFQYLGDRAILCLRNLNRDNYEYTLWDSQGRKLGGSPFEASESGYDINLANKRSGYYIIRLQSLDENREYMLPFLLP